MKPAAILLHGALGSEKQLLPLKQFISGKFEVYTLNFTGHGGKALEGQFGIEKFSQDLANLLDQEHLNAVNIFGYSMGGYVALYLAQTDSRITKIFTLGTKFAWSPETSQHEVKMLNPAKIEEKVPAFAKALEARHAPEDWKVVMHKTSEMMLSLGDSPILNASSLKDVKIPVTIGLGSEDNMVTEDESRTLASSLPNASFKLYKGFKHPIEQIDTTLLANDLTDFFLKES
ncbi:alpha/beta fold hydrolase [Fulvivirga lutimaris]|uniref:alpha/beta fold hydrolase n=1 Tax=Fulvivirga lutimaris TaxID=1819566 RepID=UPI0012BBC9FE|nr:alpha/beta hydrolase [Fulvivirga lutimaris]MTI39797.1 alpha/beta hydrolase [Fulvivirga lutimaris]